MQYFSYHNPDYSKDTNTTVINCKGSKFFALLYSLPTSTQELANTNTTKDYMPSQSQKTDDIAESITIRNVLLANLQAKHKKAVHFVWAFRILNEYNHIVEGSSDDGEPKGSAGAPMLEALRGKCLVNTLCVCVRYFGGTKLGIGGLVRAYTQATLQAIDYAQTHGYIIAYKKQSTITIHDKSSAYNKILHLAKKHSLTITHKYFLQTSMTLHIRGESQCIDNFLQEKATC